MKLANDELKQAFNACKTAFDAHDAHPDDRRKEVVYEALCEEYDEVKERFVQQTLRNSAK